jgi:hypothetical protein
VISLPRAILWSAGRLVPLEQRADWLAEWRSELWHLRRRGGREALSFCVGAIPDAFWIRRNVPAASTRKTLRLESPVRCILFLAVLAAASVLLALRLPSVRDAMLPPPYPDAKNLVLISPARHYGEKTPGITLEEYRTLTEGLQGQFSDVAFYRPVRIAGVRLAVASRNLFELLSIPITSPVPALVLSRAAWHRYYAGDSRITGRIVPIAGRRVPVAAVIPDDSWRLPARVEAWLIEDEPGLAALPPSSKGFVVGRLSPAAPLRANWRWELPVPNPHGSPRRYEFESLARRQFVLPNLLILGIALLLLPLATSLWLGDYPPGTFRLRRWIFLGVKVGLLLPIVLCGTMDLGSIIAIGEVQPHGLLVGYILAFRWALTDQRQRCPVCLRLLSNPTRIGWASQIFLEWYGTEFMCRKGHGLLHVPEIPSSCNAVQQWLALDASWSSLFS